MPTISLKTLREFAFSRTLFAPTDLPNALHRLGFVQIDPINAPASAQDLILRHRVDAHQKGDMARFYPDLAVEEAYFVNHGYVPKSIAGMLYSNKPHSQYLLNHAEQVAQILQYAQDNIEVHPKLLNQHIGHQTVKNNWGGAGLQATQTVQRMHNHGMLRIVRRDKNTRVYGLRLAAADVSLEAMIEAAFALLLRTYAPLTAASMTYLGRLLAHGRPDAKAQIKQALARLSDDFAYADVDGVRWFWPRDESLHATVDDKVRLFTPFDPLVWDRARFETFWGWTYKFEAYKPANLRQFGYYALPLFWRDDCIGWGNVSVVDGRLQVDLGYVRGAPSDKRYKIELESELMRLAQFLRCEL